MLRADVCVFVCHCLYSHNKGFNFRTRPRANKNENKVTLAATEEAESKKS